MATIYLRSTDGNDADSGATWALAKATLASALSAAGAGGIVYVSQVHAETQASAMTLTSPGTAASPVQIICVNDAAEPPTATATTATVDTTGSNGITFAGFAYSYGVSYRPGVTSGGNGAHLNFSSTSPWWWCVTDCSLECRTSGSAGAKLNIGLASSALDDYGLFLKNVVLRFGNTGQGITLNGRLTWHGGSLSAAGTIPTNLFAAASSTPGVADVIGVDLSATTTNLVLATSAQWGKIRFQNCKLGAGVVVANGAIPGQGGLVVDLVNCDSGDPSTTGGIDYFQDYAGSWKTESTIVRTGGSSNGTTPISYKFVSTANSKHYAPLYGPWVTLWNETTGSSIDLTAEIVTDNVTLTDAEAWIEVMSMNTAGVPLGSFTNDQIADPIFGTPANQASSSVAWTTTGLTTPVKQKLVASVTPAEKGPIYARVVLAKASTTVYADGIAAPFASARQYMLPGNYVNEAAAAGGGSRGVVIGG